MVVLIILGDGWKVILPGRATIDLPPWRRPGSHFPSYLSVFLNYKLSCSQAKDCRPCWWRLERIARSRPAVSEHTKPTTFKVKRHVRKQASRIVFYFRFFRSDQSLSAASSPLFISRNKPSLLVRSARFGLLTLHSIELFNQPGLFLQNSRKLLSDYRRRFLKYF